MIAAEASSVFAPSSAFHANAPGLSYFAILRAHPTKKIGAILIKSRSEEASS